MKTRAHNAATLVRRAGVYLHHNAATCGVDSCGDQKQTAERWDARPFGSLKLPLCRGPHDAINVDAGYLHGRHHQCPRVPIAREVDSRTTQKV